MQNQNLNLKIQVNNIIEDINHRISITNDKLLEQIETICSKKQSLIDFNLQVIHLQDLIQQSKNEINENQILIQELIKDKLNYENEILQLNGEIENLKNRIDSEIKVTNNGILDIFYPVDDIVTDISRELMEQLNECNMAIKDNKREIQYKLEEIIKYEQSISASNIQVGFLIKKLNIFKNCQKEKAIEISKVSREKVITENQIQSLKSYVNHIQIILTKCEKNNDSLIDFGINDLIILLNN